ncbi:MAG: hypothetical protein FWC42_11120 [Proteobacteria bacterium]|nr:hypothetical protein [Pseudomonadota bacterium]
MQGVRGGNQQSGQRPVSAGVPALLRPAGGVGTAIAPASGADAGCDCALSASAWPGRDFGVRQPYPGETPLSWDEVHFARERGLI